MIPPSKPPLSQDALSPGPMTSRWDWMNWPARVRQAVAVSYWLLLNGLLFAPSRDFEHLHFFSLQDKLGHLALFAALAALVRWSIPRAWGRGWRAIMIVATVIAYGVASECIQPLVPGAGRSFEWFDIAMDCIGSAAGFWLCGRLERRRPEPGG